MLIHVDVTAEDIAAAGPPYAAAKTKDPIERSLERVFGREVGVDGDRGPGGPHDVATIGQGQTTLVVDLPSETFAWSERYYSDEPVEPFSFELEIEDWLVAICHAHASPEVV